MSLQPSGSVAAAKRSPTRNLVIGCQIGWLFALFHSDNHRRMPDLRPDKARKLGRLMLELHGDFRRRHGLPPVPSAWTLHDHLRTLRSRSSLIDRDLLRSPKPVIGAALKSMRTMVWTLLRPIFYRQSEVNRDVLLTLEALARDSEARRGAHDSLSARIAELETAVARMRIPRE